MVWVDYGDNGGVSGVSAEPIQGRAAFELHGVEGKILVDRERLGSELIDGDGERSWCRWSDCDHLWVRGVKVADHSGTCPLADPEPAAQVKSGLAATAETVTALREDLEHAEEIAIAEEVALMLEQSPDDIEGGPAGDDGRPPAVGAVVDLMESLGAFDDYGLNVGMADGTDYPDEDPEDPFDLTETEHAFERGYDGDL